MLYKNTTPPQALELSPLRLDESLPSPRSWVSLPVIGVSLVAGLFITLLLFRHFINLDQERLQERVQRGVETLAAYSVTIPPQEAMFDAFRVLGNIQTTLMQQPAIDTAFLQRYLWTPSPPSHETITLRYHPKVSYRNDTHAYEMLTIEGKQEPFNIPILDTDPAGVKPATPRDEYYPVMLESAGGIKDLNPIGLNHFYDDTFHLALDEARDTGKVSTRIAFPQSNNIQLYLITTYFIALYTPGPMPTTISERRQRHVGFVSATSFTPSVDVLKFHPESYQGLDTTLFVDSPAFSEEQQDAGLKAALAHARFAHATFQYNGKTTHIFARPSYSFSHSMQTPNRWWALGIGSITTIWICSLLLLLRKNSTEMQLLVEQRTRALAERTRRLGETNLALSESEGRYRMLANNVSDVIFTVDAFGICTYISPSITQQNGFLPQDYIGKPIYSHATANSVKAIREFLQQARENTDTFRFDDHYQFETLCSNGSTRNVEISFTKLTTPDGHYNGMLGVSRDISDRLKSDQEKTALQEAFRQSQKMEAIGTLAGGVAHDFNNLLTGILGHAELVQTQQLSDHDIKRSLTVIETAALRAKELTTQLLGFARKSPLQIKAVSINPLVEETIALLDRTINKNIKIKSTLCPSPLVVSADPGQITQILLNLAVNARDAMPEGGTLSFDTTSIVVDEYFTYTHYEELKPGAYCLITVSDTGLGIAKENLTRIFEPFFSDKPAGMGTGLGLAMVYGVTRSHGGTVTVYSEVGIGTVFKVYLPLASETQHGNLEAARHPVTGKGTVLLVDDEAIVRNMVEAMLQKLGYRVLLTADGAEALMYYRDHWQSIDLVILDMIMPNLGGRECLEQMRKINPDIRAIISTGFAPDAFTTTLIHQKNFGFLQKPYRLQELSEIVAATLFG